MSPKNDLSFLKNFLLFSELKDKELQKINEIIITVNYPEQYTIFFEGEKGERVYFLNKGKVKVLRSSKEGNEQILDIIKEGEVFGEVVLFDIEEYPATTRTISEVEVSYLKRSHFREFFNNNPNIGWGMLKVMARKLTRSQHQIENLGLRKTRGRVATLILDMIDDFGSEENKVILNFNRQELANFIGTSRETVSRTLNKFKEEGLIKLEGDKLIVLNSEGLRNIK